MIVNNNIIRLKTVEENTLGFGKAAILPAVAILGLKSLGLNIEFNDIKANMAGVFESIKHGGPAVAGFVTGLIQNAHLIRSTLNKLDGKTQPGNYEPIRQEVDGTYVFQIPCIDKRRVDKSGGAVAGSYGPMGSEFVALSGAMIAEGISPNSGLGDFHIGYFLGSNVMTEGFSHYHLIKEINRISSDLKYEGHRIKIEMMDHWDGCGAEGFTNPLTYWLKFKAHQLALADLSSIPNEVAGYIYVNGILGPAVGILSGGRISLSAVLKHSEMEKHAIH